MATSAPVRQSSQGGIYGQIREIYQYRELLRNLVISDLKARYKNSVLGFFWSLLNPLGMMLVFTLIFGLLVPNVQIERYPLFLLCGLLPWNYFSASVQGSLYSVLGNAGLVKKVYFPRAILPIATVLSQLINFLLAFVILFAALLIFQSNFSPWLWLLPFVLLIQTIFTIGVALILSTLNVFYRDTSMIMDVLMLAWFFLTPVFYSTALLPDSITLLGVTLNPQRLLYILNPMASLVNMYRDLLYWGYRTDLDFFLRSAVTAVAVLLFGAWFFRRYSDRFGEEL
ncbi:MAG: ABC transporter permease [Caldilinea sp.]|nr:ABC transporter permease [Caldilinea sp.]MCB0056750.1 ABC transporter permease [Caldilineaceae bacterium]MCB0069293.1 ABC transporter permease [Caldilineaceae bacterium]MCB9115272.1 ABC transporter permease [Caldilineaceae bacterium]MCB9119462.1 ABC transporter permease [Caldilineaceae bacterium]